MPVLSLGWASLSFGSGASPGSISGDQARKHVRLRIGPDAIGFKVFDPHSQLAMKAARVDSMYRSGGPLAYGMGDKMDPANAGSLEKGYHVTLGGKMNHWASTTAPTEIEVKAMGPFAITTPTPPTIRGSSEAPSPRERLRSNRELGVETRSGRPAREQAA